MSAVDTTAADWRRAKAGMLAYLDAMPQDGMDFRPAPEVMTFCEQLLHTVVANCWLAFHATGKPSPYEMADLKDDEKMAPLKRDKDALREFVAGGYDFVIGAVEGLGDAALGETITFRERSMPRYVMLAKTFEHHAHHRGQLAVYLRARGIKPPSVSLFS